MFTFRIYSSVLRTTETRPMVYNTFESVGSSVFATGVTVAHERLPHPESEIVKKGAHLAKL